uniref:Beta/gamma crystallin 'Greek key' domain-containing protein n=1 Tax=Cyprinus carpio TaxID=7962 RepID=A0A8C2CB87_CYPCA
MVILKTLEQRLSSKCVIELYDQHAFKGTKCVITGNCPSLDHCSITEVRSCKVIRGVWKLWKGRGYNGDDYLLKEGDNVLDGHLLYLDSKGKNSPSLFSLFFFKCVIELYDQHAFKGTKCVITGNCPSLDRCSITEVRSCKVIRGVWKLWKGRGYNGDDYLLKVGEYPDLKALSIANPLLLLLLQLLFLILLGLSNVCHLRSTSMKR